MIRKKRLPRRENRGFTGDPVPPDYSPNAQPTENRGLAGDLVGPMIPEAQVVHEHPVLFHNPCQEAASAPGLTGLAGPDMRSERTEVGLLRQGRLLHDENPDLTPPENLKQRVTETQFGD